MINSRDSSCDINIPYMKNPEIKINRMPDKDMMFHVPGLVEHIAETYGEFKVINNKITLVKRKVR